jgi:hypothetical protein
VAIFISTPANEAGEVDVKNAPVAAPCPSDASLSIPAFCAAENISKTTYHKLRLLGLGPEEMRFPGTDIVRITFENRKKWHERIHALPPEQRKQLVAEFAKRSERCRQKTLLPRNYKRKGKK